MLDDTSSALPLHEAATHRSSYVLPARMVASDRRDKRATLIEYRFYFALFFVVTLPLATLVWGLEAVKSRRLPDRSPVARALSQARCIAPMIFAA